MAGDRPLLVLHDEEEGHLVYDLLLLLDGEAETLACFPRPVARFPSPLGCRAFAVSGGSILGAPYNFWGDTVFHDMVMKVDGYDFWERQPSPRMRDEEGHLVRWWPMGREFDMPPYFGSGYEEAPAMLPMGDDGSGTVIRMDRILFDGICSFETLRRSPVVPGGWRAAPLPKPPIGHLAEDEIAFVSAYLALGTRVWISVADRGTFSLDTQEEELAGSSTACWRVEGTWQLPFQGRALHVPELGCAIGLTATTGILCACDVEAGTPPVVRHVWRETLPLPWEECGVVGVDGWRPRDLPSLAYLGKGRFCICRPMSTMEPNIYAPAITYDGSCFLVVEVRRLPSGELELARRGRMSYMKPPQGRRHQYSYIGFIQPAIYT